MVSGITGPKLTYPLTCSWSSRTVPLNLQLLHYVYMRRRGGIYLYAREEPESAQAYCSFLTLLHEQHVSKVIIRPFYFCDLSHIRAFQRHGLVKVPTLLRKVLKHLLM